MKLSIHPDIKGKPTKTDKGYFVGDKQVNLGYGWMNVDVSWDDAFELITTDGYATSSELNSDNRTDSNFVSRQLIMVDIDDGMTIPELLQNEFYNEFGAGFYATASHTDEHHRFRIMFQTEEPIIHNHLMKQIIRGLMLVYNNADANCKDASRLYYGVPNCTIKENQGKILTKDAFMSLSDMVKQMDKEEAKTYVRTFEPTNVDETFVDQVLNKISYKVGTLQGDYELWRTIAWATCHTIGISSAQSLMMKYWPTKTKKEMTTLKSWKQSHNGPTIGTLIKLSDLRPDQRKIMELQAQLRKKK